MTIENPYQPPKAEVADVPDEAGVLAGRGQRLAAAMIDGLIGLALAVPILLLTGTFDLMRRGQPAPFAVTLINSVLGFALFALVHGYFLKRDGQTIGKKLIGIRITALDHSTPALDTVLGRRYLPISLVMLIPVAGQILPLLDVLFIFRADRRCIHDLIAGTKVVRVR